MDKLYKIKPLEWTEGLNGEWQAYTPFGNYTVGPNCWRYWLLLDLRGDGEFFCASIEAGKAAAEAHWRERIRPMLDQVEP